MSESEQMDMLVNYLAKLARAMMANGSTVEHTTIAVIRNAEAYHVEGLSCLIMNNYISVSFHDSKDHTYFRQLNLPSSSINLEKLRLLNNLSYEVCSQHPPVEELGDRLRKTKDSKSYSPLATVLCQMLAICSICGIIGGSIKDMIATGIVTFVLFWLLRFLNSLRTDRIINNMAGMFLATFLAYMLADLSIASNVYYVLVAISLLMIPGIPLVNAFRNLICGNELNGFVQLLHVILEAGSLAVGTWAGLALRGGMAAW